MLTAVMNNDLYVPADDLTVAFPYDKEIIKNADYLTAYKDGELVFTGQIDEIINIKSSASVITSVTARSLAAMLLDNEAEPLTYINPAPEFIYNKHLKPFNIKAGALDSIPFYGNFKIDKGMTHWQVLKSFCKNRFDSLPRITGGGEVLFEGCSDEEAVKFGTDGIGYYSLRENNKRCELISEVRIKLDEYGGYTGTVTNENEDCRHIERVRYVNTAADTSTIETADAVIEQSNIDSYMLTLECKGCMTDKIGKRAEVNDEALGELDGLRVSGTKYVIDSSGEHTAVYLRRE